MNYWCRRFSPHIHLSISCRRDPPKIVLVSIMVRLLDCRISCWRVIFIVVDRILAQVIAFLPAETEPNVVKVGSPYREIDKAESDEGYLGCLDKNLITRGIIFLSILLLEKKKSQGCMQTPQ